MTQGLLMKYFVLRPGKDDMHGAASRTAMLVYADEIEADNPNLANELREWVENINDDIARIREG